MKIHYSFLFFFFINSFSTYAQFDCEDFYKKDETLNNSRFNCFAPYASPAIGFLHFRREIYNMTKNQDGQGIVYIKFITDTLGQLHCIAVAESNNPALNDKAIELIRTFKFKPAELLGFPIVTINVIEIKIGQGSDPYEKIKNRKNIEEVIVYKKFLRAAHPIVLFHAFRTNDYNNYGVDKQIVGTIKPDIMGQLLGSAKKKRVKNIEITDIEFAGIMRINGEEHFYVVCSNNSIIDLTKKLSYQITNEDKELLIYHLKYH